MVEVWYSPYGDGCDPTITRSLSESMAQARPCGRGRVLPEMEGGAPGELT